MGLTNKLGRMFRSKAALTNPADPSVDVLTAANVTQREDMVARSANWNQSQMLAQFAHSLALDAALFNAKCLASVPLRLYRKAEGSGGLAVRQITRQKARHLRNPESVGRKAAMMADASGDVVEVMDSPALDLLRHPDPDDTALAWDVRRFMDKQWYGEALLLRDEDGPFLPLLFPQWARVQPDTERGVSGWYYGRDSVAQVQFDRDDVFQMKWAKHPSNPYRGLGWAELCLQEIGIDKAMLNAESYRWKRGGYPKAHLALDTDGRNEKQIDEIRAKIKQQMRDDVEVLVTSTGSLTPFALPKDMTFDSASETIERRILNRAGIPVTLYRMQDANRAAALATDPVYARYTLAPALAIDAEQWTELLLPWFGLDNSVYFFAYDEVSGTDRTALRADVAAYVGQPAWTVNEGRAELGYDKYDDPRADKLDFNLGGGFGAVAASPIVTSRPGQTADSPEEAAATGDVAQTALNGAQVTALQGLVTSVAQGQMPSASARALAEAAFPLIPPQTLDRIFGGLDTFTPDPTTPEPAQAAQEPVARSWEPELRKAWAGDMYDDHGHAHAHKADERLELSEQAVRGIEAVIREWLKSAGAAVTADAISGGVSLADMDEDLAKALEPLIADLFRAGASQGFASIGVADSDLFEVVPQAALEAVQRHNSLIVEQIRGTTEDGIRRAIAEGLDQGLSATETQKLVQGAVTDSVPWRAEAIARTEAANANMAGNQAAWMQAGVEGKRWLLAPDACSICRALVDKIGREGLESKAIAITEPFIKAGETLIGDDGRKYTARLDTYHPPLHPNDRCAMVAELPEGD